MKAEFYYNWTGDLQKKIYIKFEDTIFDDMDKLSPEMIEEIFDIIKRNPKVKKALLHLSTYFPGDKKEILERFIFCNWTELDGKWDINDRKLNFEKVNCPFKNNGKCPYKGKGIVCIKV